MIRLHCSNCAEVLEVDDAFAGGVCRCRHCGAIQSVPADGSTPEGGEGQVVGSKPLYRREEQKSDASGLDELASIVSSGMLSASALNARRGGGGGATRRKPMSKRDIADPPAKGPDRRLAIALGVAAVLGVLAVGLAVALVTGGEPAQVDARPEVAAPTFAGLPLGSRVVWVVDRGADTAEAFGPVNDLILATAADLPAGSQFQVVYWPRLGLDDRPPAVPGRSMRAASPGAVEQARRGVQDIPTGGRTDALPALGLALAEDPDTIVLVTGKGWALDAGFADRVLETLGDADVVVHTLAVGTDTTDGVGRPLATIAQATGGEFRALGLPALRAMTRQ